LTEEPETLEDIGGTMGVSRERIRQIEAEALNKMRRALKRITKKDDAMLWGAAT
jgi:RNA polymerase sigma-32 factor